MLLWLGLVLLPTSLALAAVSRLVSRATRLMWISWWARHGSAIALGILARGGAGSRREGFVPSDAPGIVLMNHQSVLDVLVLCVMTGPLVPAFVARERYARAPVIGTGLWLADCPVIDPRKDRAGAVECLRKAMAEERAIALYPEGHRSPDGTLQPFRPAGLLAMLATRRVPVWLVATDGFQAARKLLDLAFNLHRIDGRTELIGRFDPPADEAHLPAFVERLHAELGAGLARLRSTA